MVSRIKAIAVVAAALFAAPARKLALFMTTVRPMEQSMGGPLISIRSGEQFYARWHVAADRRQIYSVEPPR
jgi:hypothetical protein